MNHLFIPFSVLISLGIGALICFGIPIVGFLMMQRKKKGLWKPFLFGMLAFVLSQEILRIPLLTFVLPKMGWFTEMKKHIYLYSIFLGLTAGIFEETARAIFIYFGMKKNQRFSDGIVFGLGHGGIEAILIVGINFIALFISSIFINSGAIVSGRILMQLSNLDVFSIFLAATERIFAMMSHVGFTMIIMTGFRKNKAVIYLIVAILAHGFIDSLIGILPALFSIDVIALEIVLAVFALLLLLYTIWSRKHIKWQEDNIKREQVSF